MARKAKALFLSCFSKILAPAGLCRMTATFWHSLGGFEVAHPVWVLRDGLKIVVEEFAFDVGDQGFDGLGLVGVTG